MKSLFGGLGRQIVIAMVAATMTSLAVAFSGTYLFYGLMLTFAPAWLGSTPSIWPVGVEWLVLSILTFIGLVVAVVTAIRLARRIVAPLVSVAASARQIARGDLAARAAAGDQSLGEAAMLVDDFNAMATRLEAMSDEVARWNAVIAHELRTPVTILKGRLQGLADGVFTPDPALFHGLLGQVDGLARLVEDLRVVSLSESGHLAFDFVDTDLSAELEGVVRVIEPTLAADGFRLVSRFDRGRCIADPGRIMQAFVALLENARRHAEPGPVVATLRLDDGAVELSVEDGGPGLPPSFVEHAFKPFRRGAGSEAARPGSGLGLSVVRAIAEAHGGTAGYVGEGRGRFFMRLPRWAHQQPASLMAGPHTELPPVSVDYSLTRE